MTAAGTMEQLVPLAAMTSGAWVVVLCLCQCTPFAPASQEAKAAIAAARLDYPVCLSHLKVAGGIGRLQGIGSGAPMQVHATGVDTAQLRASAQRPTAGRSVWEQQKWEAAKGTKRQQQQQHQGVPALNKDGRKLAPRLPLRSTASTQCAHCAVCCTAARSQACCRKPQLSHHPHPHCPRKLQR
eukprot:scaffold104267_cov29-Tisochrysis_lutea.AAC.1